ncbi:MAG: 50S ribosomal protein L10 [Chloroflexi bacterium RBG_19FT_COMBO_48_23]|nr:MAG: 50S ribosomal protein L10 [Chloroflexi bacterium RBG_19FT_COMBO_48_23]
MLKEKKEQMIDELAGSLSRCTIAVATDYRGLTAKEMVQLRRRLTDMGVEYRVIKNTLTRFAAEKAGKKQLEILLTGPVAMAFGYDDVVKPAQVLREHIRSASSVLQIKGGIMGDKLLTAEDIANLATMPPKDVMIARLVWQLNAPLQALHNVLSAPLHGLLNVMQARMKQVEGG